MKRLLFSTSLVLALGAGSQMAMAADGTITFTGTVTATTCTINAGVPNFTVTLPVVSNKSLSAIGSTAGNTPFPIALTACTPASGNVHTYFEAGATVNTADGRLINSGTSTGVEVGLLNASNLSQIHAGAADASEGSLSVAIPVGGAVTLNYVAQYYATVATPAAGTVTTSVTYTIAYN